MSCCNQKRIMFSQNHTASKLVDQGASFKAQSPISCRYTGNGFSVFRGAITGFKYIFKYRGHQLKVDPRDAVSLQAEPLLTFLE